jgi:hypothetical protein
VEFPMNTGDEVVTYLWTTRDMRYIAETLTGIAFNTAFPDSSSIRS